MVRLVAVGGTESSLEGIGGSGFAAQEVPPGLGLSWEGILLFLVLVLMVRYGVEYKAPPICWKE